MTMEIHDLVLKNAEVLVFDESQNKVTRVATNLAVTDGRISAISNSAQLNGKIEKDLKNLTILPGVIDSQVHFREPGFTHKEDLESGTRAALLGGVTSIFEMPNTNPITTTTEAFQDKLDRAKGRAHCHYAFYIGGSSDNFFQLNTLENLPHCSGVKIFLGSSFGTLLVNNDQLLESILQNGKRRVIIHSEDEDRLNARKHIAIEMGHPKAHPIWRDEESALISTKKAVHFATKYNRPIHILHVSSSEEMAFLKNHKDIASVEMLPQYLTLSSPECYERLGTLAQQNPPIRDQRHMKFLWQAMRDGTVDIIGSDHAPHTLEEKNKPYPQSPSGVPGVQTLVPLMLDHVSKGQFSLEQFVTMVSENPRRLLQVKNKGRIQVGFDADFTIVDLNKTMRISNSWIASKCGWTPYDGMIVKGWPTQVYLKGNLTMQDDTIIQPHRGEPVEFTI
ncbi:MAG: dihydroorotase [Bdellovibrionales bacterium RIFCSPHIGHO2_01_FULL_40_29]|nr:MAG: dihydroorotase [Bdellovibrionales bacterium RIFCSPHIGHO2_01_FULL_40_29]OFZ33797.1 MAG: dihydroorotase [Bdellovibrionales bacterium RIFCSPHIGHO2_02_FULL_40_15]